MMMMMMMMMMMKKKQAAPLWNHLSAISRDYNHCLLRNMFWSKYCVCFITTLKTACLLCTTLEIKNNISTILIETVPINTMA